MSPVTSEVLVSFGRNLKGGAVLAAVAVAAGSLIAIAPAAGAATSSWVVSVGDSYISGEAGRWAGNTNNSARDRRAGPDRLLRQRRPHRRGDPRLPPLASPPRSTSAAASAAMNLACSRRRDRDRPTPRAATSSPGWTSTTTAAASRPGADAADTSPPRHKVTAWSRCRSAATTSTSPRSSSTCVEDFLTSPSWWPDYCSDDSSVTANFTAANVAAVTAQIAQALRNVRTAMANAGYADSDYTHPGPELPVADPRPPPASATPSAASPARPPAAAASGTPTPTGPTPPPCRPSTTRSATPPTPDRPQQRQDPGHLLAVQRAPAVREHRRHCCRSTASRPGRSPARSTAPSGSTRSARSSTGGSSPYYIQESLHPNYWGQLALRRLLAPGLQRRRGARAVTAYTTRQRARTPTASRSRPCNRRVGSDVARTPG